MRSTIEIKKTSTKGSPTSSKGDKDQITLKNSFTHNSKNFTETNIINWLKRKNQTIIPLNTMIKHLEFG